MAGTKHYKNDYIDKALSEVYGRILDPEEDGITEDEKRRRIKENRHNSLIISSLNTARGRLDPYELNPEGEVEYFGPRQDDFGTKRDRRWGLIDEEGFFDPTVRENIYNSRGEMQSGLGKISNGVVKAVTTTATTIGRTAGMLLGIPAAIAEGDAALIFNNDITKAMDAVDEAMERWLPTYRSFKEENGNWWERNMSAAGISDFIKNWGFTIGSVITGNIAGLAMKGVRKAALKKMVPLLVSTMGEASMEAAQVMNDMMEPAMDVENTRYQAELADIASKYKNNPEYGPEVYDQLILEANDRHQKELDRIYDRSRAAGLWTMGLNNVVLSISNNMFFGAVLKGDAPLERVLQNGINRRFKRLVGDDMRRAITDEEKKKLIGGGAKRLLGAIKTGFSEGGEELSQKYISNAFTNYYNSVLGEDIGRILTEKKEGGGEFDDIINDYYGSMYDDGSVKEADGLWRSLWMTLGETLTDKQSWDEFTAGAAMGLLGMPTFGRRANSGASTVIGRGGMVGWSGGVAGNIRENRMEAARNSAIISQYNDFVNTYRKGPKGDQLDEAIRHIVGGITSDRKSEAMLDLMRNAGTLTQEQEGAIRNEYDRQMHEVISHAVAAYQSVGMLKQLKASVDDMMDDPAGFASDIYANAIVEEDDGNGGKVKRNIYDDITWKGKNGKSVSGQDALTELVRDRATELHNEIEFFEKVRGHLDEKYGHIMSDKSLRDMTFLYSQVHFMEGNSLDEIDRMVEGGRLAETMRTASSHSMTKLQDELKKANEEQEKENERYEKEDKGYAQAIESQRGFEKQANAELDEATKELEGLKAERDELRKKHSSMKEKIEEEKKSVDAEHRQYGDDIQALKDKIASLEQTLGIKGLAASRKKKISSEVESLKKQLLDAQTKDEETLDKQLDIEKRKKDIESNIKSEESDIEERLKKSEKKVSDSKSNVKSVQNRLDEVVAKRDELTRKREEAGNTHSEKVGKLESEIASTNETIEKLNEALDFLRGYGQRGADATRADYRIERLRLADEEKSAKDNLAAVEKYISAMKTIAETDTSKLSDEDAEEVLRIKNMANTALANLNTVKHYLENLQRLQAKPEQMEMDESIFRRKKEDKKKEEEKKGFKDDIANAKSVKDIRAAIYKEDERRKSLPVEERSKHFDIDKEIETAANNGNRFAAEHRKINSAREKVEGVIGQMFDDGKIDEAALGALLGRLKDIYLDAESHEEVLDPGRYQNMEGVSAAVTNAFNSSMADLKRNVDAEESTKRTIRNEKVVTKAAEVFKSFESFVKTIAKTYDNVYLSDSAIDAFKQCIKTYSITRQRIENGQSVSFDYIERALESLKRVLDKNLKAQDADGKTLDYTDREFFQRNGINASGTISSILSDIKSLKEEAMSYEEKGKQSEIKPDGNEGMRTNEPIHFSISNVASRPETTVSEAKKEIYNDNVFARLLTLSNEKLKKLKERLENGDKDGKTPFPENVTSYFIHTIDRLITDENREVDKTADVSVQDLNDAARKIRELRTLESDSVSGDITELAIGGKDFEEYYEKDHKDVIDTLNSTGAHDYLRKGMLKEGTKITFAIHPDYVFNSPDGRGNTIRRDRFGKPIRDNEGNVILDNPVIWIVTQDEVANANGNDTYFGETGKDGKKKCTHQVLNLVDQSFKDTFTGDKLLLMEDVRSKFVEWYDKPDRGEVFVYEFPEGTSLSVDEVSSGVVPYNKSAETETKYSEDGNDINVLFRKNGTGMVKDDAGNEIVIIQRKSDGNVVSTSDDVYSTGMDMQYASEDGNGLVVCIKSPGGNYVAAYQMMKRKVSEMGDDDISRLMKSSIVKEITDRIQGEFFGFKTHVKELLHLGKGYKLSFDHARKVMDLVDKDGNHVEGFKAVRYEEVTDIAEGKISVDDSYFDQFVANLFDFGRRNENAVTINFSISAVYRSNRAAEGKESKEDGDVSTNTGTAKAGLMNLYMDSGMFYIPRAKKGRVRVENVQFSAFTEGYKSTHPELLEKRMNEQAESESGNEDFSIVIHADELSSDVMVNDSERDAATGEETVEETVTSVGTSKQENGTASRLDADDDFSDEEDSFEDTTEKESQSDTSEETNKQSETKSPKTSRSKTQKKSKKDSRKAKFTVSKVMTIAKEIREGINVPENERKLRKVGANNSTLPAKEEADKTLKKFDSLNIREKRKANLWLIYHGKRKSNWNKLSLSEKRNTLSKTLKQIADDEHKEMCRI